MFLPFGGQGFSSSLRCGSSFCLFVEKTFLRMFNKQKVLSDAVMQFVNEQIAEKFFSGSDTISVKIRRIIELIWDIY